MRYLGCILVILTFCSAPSVLASSRSITNADSHSAPLSATSYSIRSLADSLTANISDETAKARAIFSWIAHNVSYDVSCFGLNESADQVLLKRRAVCAGYANLFEALADSADIQSKTIRGEAKGIGPPAAMTPDGLLKHDWNAVYLDGKWHLLDCAWGAGRIDEYGRFVPRYDEHYFLTPPEQLIYDHLPEDPRWQLVPAPISRNEFIHRPIVKPAFFEYDLKLKSHTLHPIDTDGELLLTIEAPNDINITATIHHADTQLDTRHTFTQPTEDGYEIHVTFPHPGDYILRVHARRRGAASPFYDCAVEYNIHTIDANTQLFPKTYLSFQEWGCRLDRPLAGTFNLNTPMEFELHAPGAREVLIANTNNEVLTRFKPTADSIFAGSVAPDTGTIRLFGKFPGYTKYLALLEYSAAK